jgi:hypothetical protein
MMKKNNLLILAVAALGFAACSSDETTAVNEKLAESNAISFKSFVGGNMRSTDADISNLASFTVDAYQTGTFATTPKKYFGDVVFTKVGVSQTYTSETKYYWPSGYNLDFYAYSPVDDGVADQAVDYVAYNSLKVTPGTTISSQADLVFARTENWGKVDPTPESPGTHAHFIDGTPAGVTINFAHAESKIIIKLKNTNSNIKVTVGNVKIGNLYGAGTYTWNNYKSGGTTLDVTDYVDNTYYLSGNWAMDGSANVAYTIPMETASSHNIFDGNQDARDLTNTASSCEMILIPQAITTGSEYASAAAAAVYDKAYISVQLKIQNQQNSAYIVGGADTWQEAIWPLTALTWLPGHKYTYTVDLAGGGYFPTNQDTNADLDPILDGAEIKFVNVTVDDWITAAGIDIAN